MYSVLVNFCDIFTQDESKLPTSNVKMSTKKKNDISKETPRAMVCKFDNHTMCNHAVELNNYTYSFTHIQYIFHFHILSQEWSIDTRIEDFQRGIKNLQKLEGIAGVVM